MIAFLKCVAEAVIEKGVGGLASMIPGGEYAYNVAQSAWKKYRDQKKDAEQRAEIQQLAQSTFEDAKRAAAEAVREATGGKDTPIELELYLSQVPAAVQQSLKRPEDPTGTTVPPTFFLNSPDDVLKLLPPRPPRFRPGDPLPGKPGWVLEKPLGVGGFGEVWLARHPRMASLIGAVKFFHSQRARDVQHESGLIDRVMRHGRHLNVVPILDVNLDGETPWLMYEYVPGGDLTDWIRQLQRIPADQRLKQATAALRQLAGAVGHFHRLSPAVVHRDLKPSNILLDKANRQLRITDFGIGSLVARANLAAESTETQAGRLLSYLRGSHTPLYASPQQRTGAPPDPRDDIHALGVIGYQLITGSLDHGAGPDFAEDLREHGATDQVVALLGRCVAHKPDRRPATGAELASQLAALVAAPATNPPAATIPLSGEPPAGPPKGVPTSAARPSVTPPPVGGGKRPGVIASIIEFLSAASEAQPLSKNALHEKLKERFPDRQPSAMWSTISQQVPNKLRVDKGIVVHKNEKGYWIEPEGRIARTTGGLEDRAGLEAPADMASKDPPRTDWPGRGVTKAHPGSLHLGGNGPILPAITRPAAASRSPGRRPRHRLPLRREGWRPGSLTIVHVSAGGGPGSTRGALPTRAFAVLHPQHRAH